MDLFEINFRGFRNEWRTHLVFLSAALLVVVENIFSDVLPAVMVSGHVIHPLLQPFIAPPARVQENPQQQHCEHTESSLGMSLGADQVAL